MAFLGRLFRSPVIQSALFLAGAWFLAQVLADASTWLALAAWFAVAFGIVGMRLGHRVGPSVNRRGAPDV